MRVPLHRLAGAAAAALLVATAGTAEAQGKGKGHGKDKEHRSAQARDDHRRDDRRHDDRRHDDPRHDGRVIYDSRGDYDPRYDPRYEGSRRRTPPGLAKKPGGMPPGQYKKRYTTDQGAYVLRDVLGRRGYHVERVSDAGTSDHVYYRDHDGHLHRAIVSPGSDRLRFSNVPGSLLAEVLSRLY